MATSNILWFLDSEREKKSEQLTKSQVQRLSCGFYNEIGTRYALVKGEGIIVLYQPLPLYVVCAIPRDRSRIFVFVQATGVRDRYSGPVRHHKLPPHVSRSVYVTSMHKDNRVIKLFGSESKASTQISSSSSAVLSVDRG
jgi:hypothetical protein